MAFNVQDDDGLVSEANAYADLSFVRAYHLDRGRDLSSTADSDLQVAIIKATQYVDTRYTFPGSRQNRDQSTEWPRLDVTDRSGYLVDGIPRAVKQATAELANRALTEDLLADPTRDDSGRAVLSKSEGVGPIKEAVEYAAGGSFQLPEYPSVDRMLLAAGLLSGGLSSGSGLSVFTSARA